MSNSKEEKRNLGIGAGVGTLAGAGFTLSKPSLKADEFAKVTPAEKSEFVNKLKPGDIIVSGPYHHEFAEQRLYQIGHDPGKMQYHAAVHTGNGKYRELMPWGKDIGHIKSMLDEDSMIALRPKIDEPTRTKFLSNVEKHFPSYEYSKGSDVKAVIADKLGIKSLGCKGRFCSNAIAVHLPKEMFKVNPEIVLPKHFLNNPNFEEIARVDKVKPHLPLSAGSIGKYILPAAGIGMLGAALYNKHMEKKSADTSEKKPSKLLNYALPAAAVGVGTYLLARKGFNKTPAQIASKGHLSWGTEEGIGESAISQGGYTQKSLYGDISPVQVLGKTKPKAVEGAYYHDVDVLRVGMGGKIPSAPESSIGYNTDSKLIKHILQNKENFGKLKNSGFIPKTNNLHEYLGKPNTFEEFTGALHKVNEPIHIKPSSDYASDAEGHLSYNALQRIQTQLTAKKALAKKDIALLQNIHKKQNQYIAMEHVESKKIKFGDHAGKPVGEARINVTITDGKVAPIAIKRRWVKTLREMPMFHNQEWAENIPIPRAFGFKHNLKRDAVKGIQDIVDANPEHFKGRNFIVGSDVIHDPRGKVKTFEINDQSGFADPEFGYDRWAGHKLYKAVTGRDTTQMAAIKGTAVGLGTGGALMTADAIKRHKQKS